MLIGLQGRIDMQRWFLSYHSPDYALAERLRVAIEGKDRTLRVFFAPTHLRAGGSWSAQLAQEIVNSTAFILLVGERGLGRWQVYEYDEAFDKHVNSPDFPLIVVLLEGQTAPGLPFLRRLHWIISPDPASERDVARLFEAASGGGSNPGELWRFTSPYRGLEAMEEKDSDYFFGRNRETVEVLSALSFASGRLPVLIGNSGVGKSSVAQAGVLAALKRQAWPEATQTPRSWPAAFHDSRQWCFLSFKPGTDPLKALVDSFFEHWQYSATDPERVKQHHGWMEAVHSGRASLPDLINATERRRIELRQPKPPGFFIYVDQGEELYVRTAENARRRFSEILARALPDPRLRMMMSMRADFFGELQKDEALFAVHHQINIPPPREPQLREIVSRPPELLSARFESTGLVDIITHRAAEDSAKDVGALPLLSYTLDDMWKQMVDKGDGVLRLSSPSFELGGVLVDRANRFLETHPGDADALRRVLLRLATVREDGEPTRRRAARAEFTDEEWRIVRELVNHPNRLLVTVTTDTGTTSAEVAHEAIFRRWNKLREWIAAEREFLAWRSGLEAARRAWEMAPDKFEEEVKGWRRAIESAALACGIAARSSKDDALLMGAALTQAQSWLEKRGDVLPEADRRFIALSVARERKVQARSRYLRRLIYVLLVGIIACLVGWINQSYIAEQWRWYTVTRPYIVSHVRPHVLTAAQEQALKPGHSFKECATDCPEMIVLPAGAFMMGSPSNEKGHANDEGPQHTVVLAVPFAVSKFLVTFDDWDACMTYGECQPVSDSGWGRGRQPVINITRNDAQSYVAWLSRISNKSYRLLSESEWEYAARAGTSTIYWFGDNPEMIDQYAWYSRNSQGRAHPVGEKKPNDWGLYDMYGNVWEWIEDCYHTNYTGAPADGSAWTADADCNGRVARGGSWDSTPGDRRTATRLRLSTDVRNYNIGFRVARTLIPAF